MASVSLDDELQGEIRRIAEDERRSPGAVLSDAVRQYVERSKTRADFLAEADASWVDYRRNRLHLSGDEARDWLRRWGKGSGAEPPDCHD